MADDSKLHIAFFPWLAFGHIIPYLQLAKLLAQKGHKISFISTPKNIDRLPISPLLTFVKIPLPQTDHLPEDAEATTDIPFNKVQYLKKAYDGLKGPLTLFLEKSDIDWLLYDFSACWLPDIANSLGISHGFFSIFLGAMLSTAKPASFVDDRTKPEDFVVPPKWVNFHTRVAFKLFEILRIFESIEGDASGTSDYQRGEQVLNGCQLIAVRSCMDFEPEWLNLLEKMHGKPCIPVGMLPPTDYNTGEQDSETWRNIEQWLDKQEKASVVYVAFGSEAKPSQTELNEIALGIELSGFPFFWTLRKRRGLADTEEIELPDGFEERTKGRGVVCTNWAPQLMILAHDSVGGFLTHSGWTSVVEASQYARPLILLTFLADQGINARLLEEKKMGYSVPRNEFDGSFTRDSVAESLKLVIMTKEGNIYREKAQEMKILFGDRDRQDGYIDNFLGYLKTHKANLRK